MRKSRSAGFLEGEGWLQEQPVLRYIGADIMYVKKVTEYEFCTTVIWSREGAV